MYAVFGIHIENNLRIFKKYIWVFFSREPDLLKIASSVFGGVGRVASTGADDL